MRTIVVGRSRSGTTIMRRILSSHPDIWITNELRTYNVVETATDKLYNCVSANAAPEDHFKYFMKKVGGSRHATPSSVRGEKFVAACMKQLKGSSLIDKLEAMEAVVFGNKFKIFGDKTGIAYDIFHALVKHEIEFRVIHIYRDGRDVVSSGLRHSKGGKNSRRWATTSAHTNSKNWAVGIREWQQAKKLLPESSFVDIRFEDFIDNPDKNYKKISNLLGADLKKFDRSVFKPKKTNRGYYKGLCPDWATEFYPDAINLLKELEYIK